MGARPLLHLVTLLLGAKRGASHPLIRIRRLLYGDFLVRALSTAAADADEPEEARGDAKSDGDPEGGEHARAH